MSSRQEFALLLKDTLRFFEQMQPKRPAKIKTLPKATPPPLPKQQPIEKKSTPPPKLEAKWKREPLPLPTESHQLRARFENVLPNRQSIEPLIPIKLLLVEEKPEHRLFLESVAKAITRSIAPASVVMREEPSSSLKLLIAPLSYLKKRFPKMQSHEFYQENGLTFFPLEDLDLYLTDNNLKRLLWNSLNTQRLF